MNLPLQGSKKPLVDGRSSFNDTSSPTKPRLPNAGLDVLCAKNVDVGGSSRSAAGDFRLVPCNNNGEVLVWLLEAATGLLLSWDPRALLY